MASIGLTENAAKAKNLPIRIGKFSLTANGKALAIGDASGFVKTVVHAMKRAAAWFYGWVMK